MQKFPTQGKIELKKACQHPCNLLSPNFFFYSEKSFFYFWNWEDTAELMSAYYTVDENSESYFRSETRIQTIHLQTVDKFCSIHI